MNKEIFLTQLREYLKILEDREQEDILAEYAQHIDMKMQKGLSEEEAIRDFGPMEELAAEILEAYQGGGYGVGDSAGGSAPGEQVVFLNCLDLGRQKAVGHNGKLNQIMEKERVICLKSLMKKI